MKRIGHDKVWAELVADAEAGRLHHAQLFVGPAHVGKSKVALNLAMHLQMPEGSPVERRVLAEGADPDTHLYLDNGEGLSIKEVRKMLEIAGRTHVRPYLIFVIEDLGRMKLEAMNALLKTLEEPPEGCVFLMTVNREEDILPTIRSRVQVRRFYTVSDEVLAEACAGHPYSEELVMFAMGRPGKLISLMENEEALEKLKTVQIELTRFLDSPSKAGAMALARAYEKDEALAELLDILLHRARTFALSQRPPAALSHMDFTEVLEHVERCKVDLRQNVNKRLLLEDLFLPFAP